MKESKKLGKSLTRNQMKSVIGGYLGPCNVENGITCPDLCATNPNAKGYICISHACVPVGCP